MHAILKRGKQGQGLVEYVLVIGLIATASLFAMKNVGKALQAKMDGTTTELNMAFTGDSSSFEDSLGGTTGGGNNGDPTTGGHF